MPRMIKVYKTTDEYIASFPDDAQTKLREMRRTITAAAPEAKEKIAYGIPTFTFHGNLVHFGGAKDHIGFYPGAAGVAEFAKQLKDYSTSKGTIRFPLDKPLPLDLVQKIVKFRVAQNMLKVS